MVKKITPSARPPVIAILGHVDHGKTTLLDKIRDSHFAATEAGGITQTINAYQINHQGRPLTFIDTPGHSAFSAMRQRGGQVADLAILIVAADDGVMPQTKESIKYIKAAKIPYLVAINKIDSPTANPQKTKTGLAETGEYVEGFGGNIPVVEISAKTGQNLEALLETLILLADIQQLKDTSSNPPTAIVIESQLHPHKGPSAALIVKSGIFRPRQPLFDSHHQPIGKIRALFDFNGKDILQAPPSTPIQIIGFTAPPAVGEIITTSASIKPSSPKKSPPKITPSSSSSKTCPVSIILKCDFSGSLEAITGSLPPKIDLVSSSVGQVTESDIHLAKAENATIICFNSKVDSIVKKLAQVEEVKIISFNLIYELLDYLKKLLKPPSTIPSQTPTGQAKVLKIFKTKDQTIYGCQVISGKLKTGAKIQNATIDSLHIGRQSVQEVKKDQQCGLILEPKLDIKEGDTLKSHSQKL